mmetsp:Transcript_76566/g.234402  ORF Transcript_76566/g.234402 Transcript_76566/m.234402 type:complete len:259 (-) Transcript_76566:105-881(-)
MPFERTVLHAILARLRNLVEARAGPRRRPGAAVLEHGVARRRRRTQPRADHAEQAAGRGEGLRAGRRPGADAPLRAGADQQLPVEEDEGRQLLGVLRQGLLGHPDLLSERVLRQERVAEPTVDAGAQARRTVVRDVRLPRAARDRLHVLRRRGALHRVVQVATHEVQAALDGVGRKVHRLGQGRVQGAHHRARVRARQVAQAGLGCLVPLHPGQQRQADRALGYAGVDQRIQRVFEEVEAVRAGRPEVHLQGHSSPSS